MSVVAFTCLCVCLSPANLTLTLEAKLHCHVWTCLTDDNKLFVIHYFILSVLCFFKLLFAALYIVIMAALLRSEIYGCKYYNILY